MPESPNFRLADPVDVWIGDGMVVPLYAGVAAGRVGVQAVRFRLNANTPSGVANLKLRIYERESNTVLLPVE